MSLLHLLPKTSSPSNIPGQMRVIQGRAADMSMNAAGGYGFTIEPWVAFKRFLILGTIENAYYAGNNTNPADVLTLLDKLIAHDPNTFVDTIVEVSQRGSALKQSPAIFALARACSTMTGDAAADTNQEHPTTMGRAYALARAPLVLRTLSHVFEFLSYCRRQRGAGSGLTRLLSDTLVSRGPDQAAYQMVKYRNRNGWTPRDLIRYAHPRTNDPRMNGLLNWVLRPNDPKSREFASSSSLIENYERIQLETSPIRAADLIRDGRLTHEMVPNHLMASRDVWEALVPNLGHTALLRNMTRLYRFGMFEHKGTDAYLFAQEALGSVEALRRGRVHPLRVMMAMQAIREEAISSRHVSSYILELLDSTLEMSFVSSDKLNKRVVVACDNSGSMNQPVAGNMTAREAAVALAMFYARTEEEVEIYGFATNARRIALPSDRTKVTLDFLHRSIGRTGEGTDCAAPIRQAHKDKIDTDMFVIVTDNDSWAGSEHTSVALNNYRESVGHNVVGIAAATASTNTTIMDPSDTSSLSVVGFDANVPDAIAAFTKEVLG